MNNTNKLSCFSLVTSCILLISAVISIFIQGKLDIVVLSFLLLGISSTIHHSRLNKWWINDLWRWLDYFFIIIFSLTILYNFYFSTLLHYTILFILIIVIYIWLGNLNEKYIPYIHGLIHILISICVLYLIYMREIKIN